MNNLTLDQVPKHLLGKGWHRECELPYLFIDGCVQIWPDTDFRRLHKYGVAAYNLTAFRPHDEVQAAIDGIAEWWRVSRSYPDIRIALTASDIEHAFHKKQTTLILASQGGDFIGQNLSRLEMFYRMGLRVMIPAYNARTSLADGCIEPDGNGLSALGRKWVNEANRIGLVIDCTHTSRRTCLDIFDLTADPVVFTHSNPAALIENPRNVGDERIRRCAATGGVVGLTNWAPLLFKPGSSVRPTLNDFLDAICYVADLVGVEHVAIGTDMSHGTYPDGDKQRGKKLGGGYADVVEGNPRSKLRNAEGFDDYGDLPVVALALQKRGFQPKEVQAILGGNFLRVFKQVWK